MGATISFGGGELRCPCDAFQAMVRKHEDLRRDLIDEGRQLTDALRRGETAEANVVGLERKVERLRAQVGALRVLKDPDQTPMPWDKAKADLRIEELEGEVKRLREALRELSAGARSTLSLGYVPADSVTHDELEYGLKLAGGA